MVLDNTIEVPSEAEFARLLGEGAVISSLGRVYRGTSAVQDAIDGLDAASSDGQIWVGNNEYDPITVQTDRTITLQGTGRDQSVIDGRSTDHALTVVDPPSSFLYGLNVKDMNFKTDQSSNFDGIHIKPANGNVVFESWFTRVRVGRAGRYGVNLDGGTGGIRGMWFTDLFIEGTQDNSVIMQQSTDFPSECRFMGFDLATDAATQILSLDGANSGFFGGTLTPGGGINGGVEFLANSKGNMVVCQEKSYGPITDNGTDNCWMFRDKVALPRGAEYSTTNVAQDRTFDANNTTVAELADIVGTMISDLGLDI